MSLDFDLVSRATNFSLQKLENIQNCECPYLFLLCDFVYPELLEKLHTFVDQVPVDKWERTSQHERRKLSWIPDTVYEETWMVFGNLTESLNNKFNIDSKFIGINVWKDTANFVIREHIDQPKLDLSIQIYVNDISTQNLATTFVYNNNLIQPEYHKNYGYLMDQRGKVLHYMTQPVPENFTRYSIYATWTVD